MNIEDEYLEDINQETDIIGGIEEEDEL